MLLLGLGNSGFFLSQVRLNRILKNSLKALKKLAQRFEVSDNVHPCHPLQKTTENSSSAYYSLEQKKLVYYWNSIYAKKF